MGITDLKTSKKLRSSNYKFILPCEKILVSLYHISGPKTYAALFLQHNLKIFLTFRISKKNISHKGRAKVDFRSN